MRLLNRLYFIFVLNFYLIIDKLFIYSSEIVKLKYNMQFLRLCLMFHMENCGFYKKKKNNINYNTILNSLRTVSYNKYDMHMFA